MIFILRHVEKDDFLPREALENRRDVNPVAFLKRPQPPLHSNLKEKNLPCYGSGANN